jgi:signal transduction histidine kinase
VIEYERAETQFFPDATLLNGAVPLDSIVRTAELFQRPSRLPEHEKENTALAALVTAMANFPSRILQTLAEKVLDVLRADSAGLSLLTKDAKGFYWPAIAGAWQLHVGGGTPRNFCPCGDVLDREAPILFTHWELRYRYLSDALPLAEEALLVPFYVSGKAVGTIWAIAHSTQRKFDAEDLRILESMGRFASAAHQTVESIEALKLEVAGRQAAEDELRLLTDVLEAKIRARTKALAQRNKQLVEARSRLAEEKLRLERSEAFLAEAQRVSRTGSFSWRPDTGDFIWSAQLYCIFGFRGNEIITSNLISSRIHPEDVRLFTEMTALAKKSAVDFQYELRLLMPDHSLKYLHLTAHGTQDKNDRLEYTGAVQDVTQRRVSEEALSKARSELAHVSRVTSLGVMTAAVAHELNQPLSGILTNASTCLRMLDNDPANVCGARKTAERTIRDANRASEVVARLRALFARKSTATEIVDLNEAAKEVIALSMDKLKEEKVVLRVALAENLPPVTGDRVQLQQVILNLLYNAAEAMSAVNNRPRLLQIATKQEGDDEIRLSVQDVGVGIDPQNIDKIFDAFHTTKSDGMGIGLSVSRSIIEGHRGRLWAIPNDGAGATFSFAIPRQAAVIGGARSH